MIGKRLALIAISLLTGQVASAGIVSIGAFSGSAVTEGFEGTAIDSNNPGCSACAGGPTGYSTPGVNSPYTFGSGVALYSPQPNPGQTLSGNVFELYAVGDFSRNAGLKYGFTDNYLLNQAAQLPGGSAFFVASRTGITAATVLTSISVEFALPSPALRVGAYLTADGKGQPILLEALDSAGNVLESEMLNAVDVNGWKSNFLGIESAGGISRVRFTGSVAEYHDPSNAAYNYQASSVLIDNLIFDTAASNVPEPGAVVLVGLGLAGIAASGRRGSRGVLPLPARKSRAARVC